MANDERFGGQSDSLEGRERDEEVELCYISGYLISELLAFPFPPPMDRVSESVGE